MATLVLIKEIGIFLALVSLAIAFISRCTDKTETNLSLLKKVLPVTGSTLVLISGLFVVMKSWSWYMGTINSIRPIAMPTLASFSESPLRERAAQTLSEFSLRMFKHGYLAVADVPLAVNPSILAFILGMLVLSIVLIGVSSRQDRVKVSLTLLVLLGGGIAYVGVLLFSFLILFTEYEGVRLASFERYLSTYTLAWFLITYSILSGAIYKLKLKYIVLLQLCCIGLIAYFVPRPFFHEARAISSIGSVNDLRVSVDNFALSVKKHIAPDEKVYFIAQNTNGLERAVFTYAMLPFTSSMEWCWSLGAKYFDGDVWTCNTSLESVLKGYDYLALYSADAQFWKNNAELFDPAVVGSQSGVFKINRKSDGVIQSFTKIE